MSTRFLSGVTESFKIRSLQLLHNFAKYYKSLTYALEMSDFYGM